MLKLLLGIYSLFCLNTERCGHPWHCWMREPVREGGQITAMFVYCVACGARWYEILDTFQKQQENRDLEL